MSRVKASKPILAFRPVSLCKAGRCFSKPHQAEATSNKQRGKRRTILPTRNRLRDPSRCQHALAPEYHRGLRLAQFKVRLASPGLHTHFCRHQQPKQVSTSHRTHLSFQENHRVIHVRLRKEIYSNWFSKERQHNGSRAWHRFRLSSEGTTQRPHEAGKKKQRPSPQAGPLGGCLCDGGQAERARPGPQVSPPRASPAGEHAAPQSRPNSVLQSRVSITRSCQPRRHAHHHAAEGLLQLTGVLYSAPSRLPASGTMCKGNAAEPAFAAPCCAVSAAMCNQGTRAQRTTLEKALL